MSQTIWRRILWMSAVAALSNMSNGLYAVDGVTLIDQSRARIGNLTPGDAPGFPVTISRSGSYRLSGNLTVGDALTTAIEITADHVTLDLNGFSIIGPNVCTPNPTRCTYEIGASGVGVLAVAPTNVPSPAGVRVLNGTVRGMGWHGIRMLGDGTVVERVYAYSNGGPGIVVGDGSVIDSLAILNSGAGIIGTIVRGSIARNNQSAGIFVRSSGVATGNSAGFNGGYGIDAACPGSIVANTAAGNQQGNIRTQGTGTCALADNAQ